MTTPLNASDVAAEIQSDDGPDAEELLNALRSSPLEGRRILQELAAHQDPVVRAWSTWAASRSLPKEDAVRIALRLAKDTDPDVSDVAVEEIVALDRQAAATLAEAFRRKLESKEFYEPITAMWALAAIRDKDSVQAIQKSAARWNNALHRNTAAVVSLLLEDQGDELIRRVRAHDHELMPWLSKGLRLLGTKEAKAALETCSHEAPDAECRRYCLEELEKLPLNEVRVGNQLGSGSHLGPEIGPPQKGPTMRKSGAQAPQRREI